MIDIGGENLAKDIVCGMDLDEKTAKHKTTYQGKTYYFCAPSCKKMFEDNPSKFIGESSTGSTQMGHSCGCEM